MRRCRRSKLQNGDSTLLIERVSIRVLVSAQKRLNVIYRARGDFPRARRTDKHCNMARQFRNISLTDPYRATMLRDALISYLDSSITELDAIQPPPLPGEHFPRANYTEEIREVITPSVRRDVQISVINIEYAPQFIRTFIRWILATICDLFFRCCHIHIYYML